MDKIFNGSNDSASGSEDLFGDEQWAFGYAAAMHGLDGAPNTQFNIHSSSQMSSQPMDGQSSQGVSIGTCNGSKGTSDKSKKPPKSKNVARRGAAFSKEEDLLLCSTFLNVSKDPITGVNQSSGGYYKRMHAYFTEHKPQGCNRTQIAIQHRWAPIQKCMSKFCARKSAVDRMNQSGKNEQDRIDDAVKLYETTEPFTIMHCWKVLCNEPKWNDRFLELNSPKPVAGTASPKTPAQAESMNDNVDKTKPEGRDAAKKNRAESSSSNAAVEVLQRLHEKSEKTEQKQDKQMAEILSRKDEKIKIQRDLFNLQKKRLKLTLQQQKKDNKIREDQNKIKEKETEAHLIAAEAGIMAVDIDKVPPHLKSYYVGMQKAIMERRGFSSSSNNEDYGPCVRAIPMFQRFQFS